MSRSLKKTPRRPEFRLWDFRDMRAVGPGSNRGRARARRLAKRRGNKRLRLRHRQEDS